MRSALMTGAFYQTDLLLVLDKIAQIGYDIIEIWCYEPHFYYQSDEYPRKVRSELKHRNITVHSLHATFHEILYLSGPDECDRIHALETIKKQARIASYLGANLIVIHPGYNNFSNSSERKNRMRNILISIEQLLCFCGKLGLGIAIENMGPGYFGDKFGEINHILNQFKRENIGLCLDTSHAHLTDDLYKYLERLGHRIFSFHISDNRGINDDHLPPGQGNINWGKFAKALKRLNYKGPLVLEILRGRSKDLYDSIRIAKDNLERLLTVGQINE